MKIHIRDLVEYLECSMRYRFRHVDGVESRDKLKTPGTHTGTDIYDEFDQALHKMAAYIFHMVEADRYPSMYNLKQQWGNRWITYRGGHTDAIRDASSWRNERKKKEKQGLRIIQDLHEEFYDKKGRPLAIDYDYTLKIGEHLISGTIDLVREYEDRIELIDWKLDDRPTTLHIKNDLEMTAAALAYRTISGKKEDRLMYYGLLTKKVQETTRTERDFRMLKLVLDEAERAIEAGIFFPVLNFKCYECPFDRHCEKKEWFK